MRLKLRGWRTARRVAWLPIGCRGSKPFIVRRPGISTNSKVRLPA